MSGMRQETKKKYEEIYRLYLEGKSKKEISVETYSSYSTIDRALQKYGGKKRKGKVHRERAEKPEEKIVPRQYAKTRRRKRVVIADGKRYIDITDWFM